MRRTSAVVFLFAVAGVASSAFALNGVALRGPDTLAPLINNVLGHCPNATGTTFVGGGNILAEIQTLNGVQTIAPMDRAISAIACGVGNGTAAGGFVFALEASPIVGAQATTGTCQLAFTPGGSTFLVTDGNGVAGVQCPGCDGANNYAVTDWRDVLKIVYAGITHEGTRDCNSDVRRSLVDQWGKLFQGGCAGGTCPMLKHAFRGGDFMSSTETFVTLLGLPDIPSNPFCNGWGRAIGAGGTSDFWDVDPIRRTCDGDGMNPGEQVCGRDAKLGLVVPVVVPNRPSFPASEQYPATPCEVGKFRWFTAGTGLGNCPNGNAQSFGSCLTPVFTDVTQPAGVNPACINKKTNCPFGSPLGSDCRVYNQWVRRPNGPILQEGINRKITGAFYRLHSTKVQASGTGTGCQSATSQKQVGCLVAGSPCSLAYGGRASVDPAVVTGTTAIPVDGLSFTTANVQAFAIGGSAYPITRKIYLNSYIGTNQATGQERELITCLVTPALMQSPTNILDSQGYFPLPAMGWMCEDFNESLTPPAGCGHATNQSLPCLTGNVIFTGSINHCPYITLSTASPLQTSVGGFIDVAAEAADADADPISYGWTATSGTFVDPAERATRFLCTAVGSSTITLTVSDGHCPITWSFPVNCVAAPPGP